MKKFIVLALACVLVLGFAVSCKPKVKPAPAVQEKPQVKEQPKVEKAEPPAPAVKPALSEEELFLAKSLEFGVFAGLFAVVGVMFTAISFGLFDALDVEVPELIARLFAAGGAGLIAVVAAGVVYDPKVEPGKQTFDEGLGKIAALLMRLLLPLALVVLAVFLAFVPLNFREPFENREVLVIFNAMLFAVVGLLVGITPVRAGDLEGRTALWLRRGVIALVVMALAGKSGSVDQVVDCL